MRTGKIHVGPKNLEYEAALIFHILPKSNIKIKRKLFRINRSHDILFSYELATLLLQGATLGLHCIL